MNLNSGIKELLKRVFDEGIALGISQGDGYIRWTDKEFEKVKDETLNSLLVELEKGEK